jgi:ribose 5-phosphate isomerase A
MSPSEKQKRRAAHEAVEQVESGMILGLGSGSTVFFALERLAECLESGGLNDVRGVPSSRNTAEIAIQMGIPLTELDTHPELDLTIDGADEVDPGLNLIKGGGGALLREKVLAQASQRNVIVIDESKLSPQLGIRHPLPIEVTAFACRSIEVYLEFQGVKVNKRQTQTGKLFLTDQSNLILDIDVGPIEDPFGLATTLESRAGIVAHGLFLNLADEVIVGNERRVRHLHRPA